MIYKIYYGDGSTFSSDDGLPAMAPRTNVQVVVQKHLKKNNDGELIEASKAIYNKDAFFWDTTYNTWLGTDSLGFWDFMYNTSNPKTVIFARTISDSEFKEILKKAIKQGLN